jgi:putative two-component system response regulator
LRKKIDAGDVVMQGSSRKILIVDDDVTILRLLGHLFENEYDLAKASTGEQAQAMLADFHPDLVMLDIMMPGIDGYETCRRIRLHPCGRGLQVIMVSAKSSREEQDQAYASGADDYVVKPFNPHELRCRVGLHFRLRDALDAIAVSGGDGSIHVDASRHPDDFPGRFLAHAHDVTATALTTVAGLRDTETGAHLVRMRSYTQILAEELGRNGPYAQQIDEHFLEDLYRASPLHDIGKVGICDAILLKPARLTPDEFETMKRHTTIGANILDRVVIGAPGVSFLSMAAGIARFHHERFDGRGYPLGLSGTEIPLPARIVAIADAYDAITSFRPYKAPQPPAAARELIQQDSASHFDPVVVKAFQRRFDTLVRVQKQTQARPPTVSGVNPLLPQESSTAGVSF